MNDATDIAGTATITSPTRDGSSTLAAETVGQKIGRYRWVICGLLFFATTVNYVDRQVLGILSKDLKVAIGWTEVDYGNIVAAFNAAYAFGLLLAGRLMDRIGTRVGYALAPNALVLAGWRQDLLSTSKSSAVLVVDAAF